MGKDFINFQMDQLTKAISSRICSKEKESLLFQEESIKDRLYKEEWKAEASFNGKISPNTRANTKIIANMGVENISHHHKANLSREIGKMAYAKETAI